MKLPILKHGLHLEKHSHQKMSIFDKTKQSRLENNTKIVKEEKQKTDTCIILNKTSVNCKVNI